MPGTKAMSRTKYKAKIVIEGCIDRKLAALSLKKRISIGGSAPTTASVAILLAAPGRFLDERLTQPRR